MLSPQNMPGKCRILLKKCNGRCVGGGPNKGLFEGYLGVKYFTWKNESTNLHVRNFPCASRRRHIPTFGRFCPKIIFCRKLSEMMFFKVIGRSWKGLET